MGEKKNSRVSRTSERQTPSDAARVERETTTTREERRRRKRRRDETSGATGLLQSPKPSLRVGGEDVWGGEEREREREKSGVHLSFEARACCCEKAIETGFVV